MSKPDSRSETYFFAFTTHKDQSITATGIQFITQTIPGPCDKVSFPTLQKADDDGHLIPLLKCSPHHAIIKEIAALPDQITKQELITRVADWRKRAKTILQNPPSPSPSPTRTAPHRAAPMKTGLELITAERQRQIEKEGWTSEHDDQHIQEELEIAAYCYSAQGVHELSAPSAAWPWHPSWWKPSNNPVRNWTKAGALFLAERDRRMRLGHQKAAATMNTNAEACAQEIDRILPAQKGEWIEAVYQLLCQSQGMPADSTQEQHLRKWASSLADEENSYFEEGYTPKQAHDEELSNA